MDEAFDVADEDLVDVGVGRRAFSRFGGVCTDRPLHQLHQLLKLPRIIRQSRNFFHRVDGSRIDFQLSRANLYYEDSLFCCDLTPCCSLLLVSLLKLMFVRSPGVQRQIIIEKVPVLLQPNYTKKTS